MKTRMVYMSKSKQEAHLVLSLIESMLHSTGKKKLAVKWVTDLRRSDELYYADLTGTDADQAIAMAVVAGFTLGSGNK